MYFTFVFTKFPSPSGFSYRVSLLEYVYMCVHVCGGWCLMCVCSALISSTPDLLSSPKPQLCPDWLKNKLHPAHPYDWAIQITYSG